MDPTSSQHLHAAKRTPTGSPPAPAAPPLLSERISSLEIRRALQSIRLRLDKEPSFRDTLQKFVPLVSFDQVGTANTHVIYGRNGTGKTHLLRAFHQYCQVNYGRAKVLPVYIDCKDLELGPVATDISAADLVTRFYRRFIITVVDALESFTNQVITVPLLQQLLPGSDASRRRSGIRVELNRIRELLHNVDE